MKLTVVNILGEPGSGKSTSTAGIFSELSMRGYRSEIVQEAAKDFIWEGVKNDSGVLIPPYILSDQMFLFAEQNRRIERLREQREIAIVECPLLMSLLYVKKNYYPSFENLVLEVHNSYNNINILLERKHDYDDEGRVQTEDESKEMKKVIENLLLKHNVPFVKFETHRKIAIEVADYVELVVKNNT